MNVFFMQTVFLYDVVLSMSNIKENADRCNRAEVEIWTRWARWFQESLICSVYCFYFYETSLSP